MQHGILKPLRVLDFTWALAGPYVTRILADFGAEVIKVQSRKTSKGAESNLTGYFTAWNRNKRSITLDMDHREAREIIFKLTSISDVVIENFSPRVMSNWGLTYAKLKEKRPDLIMISISAMGQEGPWRDFVAFGQTLQALSGITDLISAASESPTGLGYAFADPVIGLYAALALLSALEYRDRTGEGQYIDLSGFEAACSLLGPQLMDAAANRREIPPGATNDTDALACPYGAYRCLGEDRWCAIAVFTDNEWNALRKVLSGPAWIDEEKFATPSARIEHRKELDQRIEQWTSQRPCEEVVALLQEAGVAAGVVQNAADLANDPHLMQNDFFVTLEHSVLGTVRSDRSPLRVTGPGKRQWKAAPLLGEDNRYVFLELLGFSENDLASYIEKGIIG